MTTSIQIKFGKAIKSDWDRSESIEYPILARSGRNGEWAEVGLATAHKSVSQSWSHCEDEYRIGEFEAYVYKDNVQHDLTIEVGGLRPGQRSGWVQLHTVPAAKRMIKAWAADSLAA
jgi:hypothetical protein